MQEKMVYLKTKNGQYPMIFTLNVMESIQDKFGSLDQWKNLIFVSDNEERTEPDIKALLFGLTEMINEGIDIENEELPSPRHFIDKRKTGRIITELGMQEVNTKLGESIIASTKNDEAKNE